ncbi:DNA ligase [Kitasatospora sp. NPDC047058]|uniref:ATP-dependent DNA ligase n=1 Tax=Kitasatospora sp. NPDC047058 TaxID=3155620 RepID=UPI0033E4A03E
MPARRRASAADPLVLHPPVEVMRPRAELVLPGEGAFPGGTQYSVKLDGFRAVVFVSADRSVVLQSRSGRNLAGEFPEIASAAGHVLPAGAVVDGEIVAYREGRIAFTELLRTRAARARAGVTTAFVAFDLLAMPGVDMRARPLAQRWEALLEALAGAGPVVQPVMATMDRAEALVWYERLADVGVEGIVARGLGTSYRPTLGRSGWVKVRHADTTDAELVAVVGAGRPRHVLVRLPGREVVGVSSQLDRDQQDQVIDVVEGRLRPPVEAPGWGVVRWLERPLRVEVRVGSGRHGTVRFVRVRGE